MPPEPYFKWTELAYPGKKVRDWAYKYGKVYIVCGPIIGAGQYGKIGDRNVQVPDAFYKAVIVPYNGTYSGIAFIMDNDDVAHPLKESYLTIDELERTIDVDLFVNLRENLEASVENKIIRKVWDI